MGKVFLQIVKATRTVVDGAKNSRQQLVCKVLHPLCVAGSIGPGQRAEEFTIQVYPSIDLCPTRVLQIVHGIDKRFWAV